MRCVKVADMSPRGYLAIDVADFISFLGPRACASSWSMRAVEATEREGGDRLERLVHAGRRVSGGELADALREVVQVIDGRFEAFDDDRVEPWAVIEAVDSSYFVLHADDETLRAARAHFTDVSDYPSEKNE